MVEIKRNGEIYESLLIKHGYEISIFIFWDNSIVFYVLPVFVSLTLLFQLMGSTNVQFMKGKDNLFPSQKLQKNIQKKQPETT